MAFDAGPTMTQPLNTTELTQELWFATPVWFMDIEDHAEVNATCIEEIYKVREQNRDGEHQSNQLGWQSRHNLAGLPWLALLQELFTKRAVQIAKRFGYKTDLQFDCWANVNHKYAYNRLHVHAGSLLSGAYYLQSRGSCGKMTFIDMRFLRQVAAVVNPDCELRHLHYNEVEYDPIVGRCFIFPSWIPHYVGQNTSDQDRISLSFNFR